MAASEALNVQGESTATTVDPTAGGTPGVASVRFPQLIPIAQLVAIVAGVLGIIWNQQQSIDNLRTELTADINRVEIGLDELRTEVANNGQRLARIEGHLGIGVPDDPPE